jgi:hypothetical protein
VLGVEQPGGDLLDAGLRDHVGHLGAVVHSLAERTHQTFRHSLPSAAPEESRRWPIGRGPRVARPLMAGMERVNSAQHRRTAVGRVGSDDLTDYERSRNRALHLLPATLLSPLTTPGARSYTVGL